MLNWYEDPEFLKETRRRLHLTQAELAKRAGVKRSLIANIESGRRPMSEKTRFTIWRVLANRVGLSADKLARWEEGNLNPKELDMLGSALDAALMVKTGKHSSLGVPLPALLGGKAREDILREWNSFFALETLKTPLQAAGDRIRALEELVESQKRMIEGYQELHKTDLKIQELLKETGPGSAAMEAVKMLEHIEKLLAENAELRSWLNAEEEAALANNKAAELRERVTVAGMRKENAEEGEDG